MVNTLFERIVKCKDELRRCFDPEKLVELYKAIETLEKLKYCCQHCGNEYIPLKALSNQFCSHTCWRNYLMINGKFPGIGAEIVLGSAEMCKLGSTESPGGEERFSSKGK